LSVIVSKKEIYLHFIALYWTLLDFIGVHRCSLPVRDIWQFNVQIRNFSFYPVFMSFFQLKKRTKIKVGHLKCDAQRNFLTYINLEFAGIKLTTTILIMLFSIVYVFYNSSDPTYEKFKQL
jgi:hypothetical protein